MASGHLGALHDRAIAECALHHDTDPDVILIDT